MGEVYDESDPKAELYGDFFVVFRGCRENVSDEGLFVFLARVFAHELGHNLMGEIDPPEDRCQLKKGDDFENDFDRWHDKYSAYLMWPRTTLSGPGFHPSRWDTALGIDIGDGLLGKEGPFSIDKTPDTDPAPPDKKKVCLKEVSGS